MTPSRRVVCLPLIMLVGVLAWCTATRLVAQEPVKVMRSGEVEMKARRGADVPMAAPASAQPQPGQPSPGSPPPGATPPNASGPKPEGAPAPDKPAEPGQRPVTPKTPPNPSELKVRPDSQGMVSFSFKGQSWSDVLEWLADISNMSLDWQEVPPGYLDLTTRGSYKVDQVRDLINSVLLSKGFTLLRNGEILMVVNLKKLDVSLVPQVAPADLDKRGEYELARVFFDLDWLIADSIADELKPMLSPNGKITALKTSNRLDVVDTAGNLRRMRDFLAEEQSGKGQQLLVREYKLKYAKAADVVDTLKSLLGLDSKTPKGPMTPEQMQAQQQAMQQAMQQAQQAQAQGKQPPRAPGPKPEVFLVLNRRENSILVNAPPDTLAVIEQALKFIDVPQAQPQSLAKNITRLQVYRLSGVDPQALVKVLEELGNLDNSTKLEVDQRNKTIIAYATLADHVTIQSLVDKTNGSERKFEVIQLHQLEAEYVAGSIEFLMRGAEKKEPRSYSYYDYGYYGGSRGSSDSQQGEDKFQVEADTDHNRLLLRATDIELQEVRQLLAKLGELPETGAGKSGSSIRVIPAMPGEETEQLLERIQRLWPSVGPNPLKVDPPAVPGTEQPPAEPEAPRVPLPKKNATAQAPVEESTGAGPAAVAPDAQSAVAQLASTASRVLGTSTKPGAPPAKVAEPLPKEAPAETPAAAGQQPEPKTTQPEAKPAPAEPAPAKAPAEAAPVAQPKAPEAKPQDNAPPAAQETPAPVAPDTRVAPDASPAPVQITRGPQGLIITSQDAQALDRLEELVAGMMPPRVDFKVLTLKHSDARDVALLLEDAFQEEGSKPSELDWIFGDRRDSEKPRNRLSKKRSLKFIPDSVTNTILVQGGDASQMSQIDYLVKLYDREQTPDSKSVRKTQMIVLKYAVADDVASVLKEVYRDLLSPNDKALGSGQQQQQERRSPYSYLFEGNSGFSTTPKFKGMLSIGVDSASNMLVLCAPDQLITSLETMVAKMDEAAMPVQDTVQVLRLAKPLSGAQVQQALSSALGSNYSGTGFRPSTQSSSDQHSQSQRSRSQRSRSRWRPQQHNHE